MERKQLISKINIIGFYPSTDITVRSSNMIHMKYLMFSIVILFTLKTYCQEDSDSLIKIQVREYVHMFISEKQDENTVFIVYYYSIDSTPNNFCLGVTYILKQRNVYGINARPNYFFEINNGNVFIVSDSSFNVDFLSDLKPIKLDPTEYRAVMRKSFETKVEWTFTYEPEGVLICFKDGLIGMNRYQSSYSMPKTKLEYSANPIKPWYLEIKIQNDALK